MEWLEAKTVPAKAANLIVLRTFARLKAHAKSSLIIVSPLKIDGFFICWASQATCGRSKGLWFADGPVGALWPARHFRAIAEFRADML
jgi:hypothetical protein